MPAPSLIPANTFTEENPPTEEQARAFLAQIHTPILDAFRGAIPGLRTSELIGWITHPDAVMAKLIDDDEAPEDHIQGVVSAAMVALSDEIDRRIPIPK